jgi:hypothetical protein
VPACIQRQGAAGGGQGSRQAPTSGVPAGAAGPALTLVRTDLGLGDGDFVRGADAALAALADAGKLRYQSAGPLPQPLTTEAGGEDVGMPIPHGKQPGEMTLTAAADLLATAPPADILVISSGYLLPAVLDAAGRGALDAKAILLLDEQGAGSWPQAPPLPVFRIRYDTRPVAFAAGVGAGNSANSAQFGVMYAADDPQGAAFAKAAAAGAKYQSNGAWTESCAVAVGPDGFVTPAAFDEAFAELKAQGGSAWSPNHFILALGRSTPTIMNALSKKPTNAYLLGAYGDYRQVRPARVVGCALKLPGNALRSLFAKLDTAQAAADPASALRAACDEEGIYHVGLAENAVGFTAFDMYSRANPDGPEIEASVESILGTIRAGELGVDY